MAFIKHPINVCIVTSCFFSLLQLFTTDSSHKQKDQMQISNQCLGCYAVCIKQHNSSTNTAACTLRHYAHSVIPPGSFYSVGLCCSWTASLKRGGNTETFQHLLFQLHNLFILIQMEGLCACRLMLNLHDGLTGLWKSNSQQVLFIFMQWWASMHNTRTLGLKQLPFLYFLYRSKSILLTINGFYLSTWEIWLGAS